MAAIKYKLEKILQAYDKMGDCVGFSTGKFHLSIILWKPIWQSTDNASWHTKSATPVNICVAIYLNGFANVDFFNALKCAASINYNNDGVETIS